MKIGEIWNFVTLFNEIVHVFTFDIEWDWCLPEQKLVFSSKSSSSISSFSMSSSSKGLPKIGAIELFGLSIVTIFNDWIIA